MKAKRKSQLAKLQMSAAFVADKSEEEREIRKAQSMAKSCYFRNCHCELRNSPADAEVDQPAQGDDGDIDDAPVAVAALPGSTEVLFDLNESDSETEPVTGAAVQTDTELLRSVCAPVAIVPPSTAVAEALDTAAHASGTVLGALGLAVPTPPVRVPPSIPRHPRLPPSRMIRSLPAPP
eukprot:TRINITY_DN1987_c3_g1_i1.p1 TRINITY_DN1987_c3_g1~~TRINITY_DN1987_c3_g1_i1.p1  ORF type:complete len:179 (+),score=26.41 TRINITY_DN1987_c3_g1_i1:94-630(+)